MHLREASPGPVEHDARLPAWAPCILQKGHPHPSVAQTFPAIPQTARNVSESIALAFWVHL